MPATPYRYIGHDEDGLAVYRQIPAEPAPVYTIPKPPATTHTTAHRATTAILIATVATLATTTGILATRHTPAAPTRTVVTTDQVTSYNDGWTDAKTDDCQQGDTTACTWLHTQH